MTDIACPAAEVALLGLLRLPSTRVLDLAERMRPDDLTDPQHRVVLGAALHGAVAGYDPDPPPGRLSAARGALTQLIDHALARGDREVAALARW